MASAFVRRLVAWCSLAAMVGVFVVPAVGVRVGWLTRVQLVPAILAGAVLELTALAVLIALFGRLYCSVICPLGIAQDLVRDCFGWVLPRRPSLASSAWVRAVRWTVFAVFAAGLGFGLTGLVEPYGIFGRFLAAGVRRVGAPTVLVIVWSVGLFALILGLSLVRARWWCNLICPVGTLLGAVNRWAVFHVRIDGKACVRCGQCARRCDKGALAVRPDKTVSVDPSLCVDCFACVGSCRKGALQWR